MAKPKKLDLRRDQKKIRTYIQRRIRDYSKYENMGPGEDSDPISLITLGYYATQGGHLSLVFDTRPNGGPSNGFDGEWTIHMGDTPNLLELPNWCDCFEELCDGRPIAVTRHDGILLRVDSTTESDAVNAIFGDMLADIAMKMRGEGWFAKLPLATNARIAIEEFDGEYFWPSPGKDFPDAKSQALVRKMGRIN